MIVIGLPVIDREKAHALSLAGRAVARIPAPVVEASVDQVEATLQAHLKARSDLESGRVAEVTLARPGARPAVYDREGLGRLDRAITAIRRSQSFGKRLFA